MKKMLWIVPVIALAGCVSVEAKPEGLHQMAGQRTLALNDIEQASKGMSYKQVKSLLKDSITIGYQKRSLQSSAFDPIKLNNPYRVESLAKNNKEYKIVYYYTKIQRPDEIVSEDEITPLVFLDDRMVGRGHDFVFNLKKQK